MKESKISVQLRINPEAKQYLKTKSKTLKMSASKYIENLLINTNNGQTTSDNSYELITRLYNEISRLRRPWYKKIFS